MTAVAIAKALWPAVNINPHQKTLQIMAWIKTKTAIVVGLSLLFASGITVVSVKKYREYQVALNSWRIARFDHRTTVSGALPQVRILPSKFKPPIHGQLWAPPDKWAGVRVSVRDIVRAAYGWPPSRIYFPNGEPPGKYDFAATLPHGAGKALQRLIQKKFGLVGRPTTMDMDVLLLTVRTPNAPGLKSFTQGNMNAFYDLRGHIVCKGFPISTTPSTLDFTLTRYLDTILKTPVIDETCLADNYDIDLKWKQTPRDFNHDALKKALLDQLGFELVPTNMSIEMLVMDKAK